MMLEALPALHNRGYPGMASGRRAGIGYNDRRALLLSGGIAGRSGYMKISLALTATLLLGLACAQQSLARDYPGILKVTFQTRDCSGATGLASVNVDLITRIQPYNCPNGQPLKQVLTRSEGGGVGEAFLINADEGVRLQAQIQRIMDARQKALEQQKPVIIQH
jgi:hypothetical protein